MIGQAPKSKRIMSLTAYKSGRIRQAVQDGSREFITLMAYCLAAGEAGILALIYKGESRDFTESWVEDYSDQNIAHFGTSENGWLGHAYGMNWLTNIFERYTRKRARNRKRLLIVNSYSSHINMAFLSKCDELGILVLILPLHSTHKLQLLDVGCFGLLVSKYGDRFNKFMFNSMGYVGMNKSKFWSLFKLLWHAAFCSEVITKAWAKSGIWPFILERVIAQITKLKLEKSIPEGLAASKTPMTCRFVRRVVKAAEIEPTKRRLQLVSKAAMKLFATNFINIHVIIGLIKAMKIEKRKKRGCKKLNLCGEKELGV